MSKVNKASDRFLQKLEMAIREGLSHSGIGSLEFITEPVRNTKLNRVCVVANGFEYMRPSERQDLIWRIVGDVLTREEQLRISMILTLTSDEMEGVDEVPGHTGSRVHKVHTSSIS